MASPLGDHGEIKTYAGHPVTMRSKSQSATHLSPVVEKRSDHIRFSAVEANKANKDEHDYLSPGGKQPVRRSQYASAPSLHAPHLHHHHHHHHKHSHKNISGGLSETEFVNQYHPRQRVSSRFNSLDYNPVESQKFIEEQDKLKPSALKKVALMRWGINFAIGVSVSVIAMVVYLAIKYGSALKFAIVYSYLKDCEDWQCLIVPTCIWASIQMALVFAGSWFVTFHAPMAAGSGIPQVKCYLNGVKIPGLLSAKTLFAKAGGIILSVVGGLACGKEGPMIHSGAIAASCIASGEFQLGPKRCGGKTIRPKAMEPLRSDEERRDFVAAGAASGVSAAFASPLGGVLFSLEEGASFLKQMLTWRMLFSSVIASLLLNVVMGAYKGGHAFDMSNPGLVTLGYVGKLSYMTYEIPIFMLMALFGGMCGATFIALNYKLTLFRRRNMQNKWVKVIEATMIAGFSAVLFMVMMFGVPNCSPIRGFDPNATSPADHTEQHDIHKRAVPADGGYSDNNTDVHDLYGLHGGHGYVMQGFCPYGQHNRMADILFKTGEGGLHHMIHGDLDEWELFPLAMIFIAYFLLTTWTYGISVSSGVFIPTLLIGAFWGRLVGMIVMRYIPAVGTNIEKYVIVGAACQLGGTVRMTISLTVILIEVTGDITFSIPIMISLIFAKWMGDFFNPGIYDLHIEIMGIPLLPWDAPDMCYLVPASEVMTAPVVSVRTHEHVGRLAQLLDDPDSHNGFPVVEDYDPDRDQGSYGKLKGFILKSQLREILDGEGYKTEYLRNIGRGGKLSEEDLGGVVDLRMHLDPNPFSVRETVSLPKLFKLFRCLGLRHLCVVNEDNRVTGMITRINLARFRSEMVRGSIVVEELDVQKN